MADERTETEPAVLPASRPVSRLKSFWRRLPSLAGALSRLPLHHQLLVAGLTVGLVSGLSVFLFESLIGLFDSLGDGAAARLSGPLTQVGIVLVPAAGGLVAGVLTHIYCPDARGHGVLEVVSAIREKGGHIQGKVFWAKSIASAATIGSGGSAGREGPIVQIGAAVGSWVGRGIGVDGELLKTLVAGGAAGGIAASFSVPLAGVFFTMEVILRNFANRAFPAVVIASVTATVTARLLLGNDLFFVPVNYEWNRPLEMVVYAALGGLCAPVGLAYRSAIEKCGEGFRRLPWLKDWMRPAVGGLLLGLLLLVLPAVRGTGQETINRLLVGDLAGWFLFLLAGGKILATALTLGSGGSGGSLMPSLFVGAALGGVYAHALGLVMDTPFPSGGFAVVGMVSVFAAAFQAPITAIIMGLEVTRDYGLLMPVMMGCVLAHLFARRPEPVPADTGGST